MKSNDVINAQLLLENNKKNLLDSLEEGKEEIKDVDVIDATGKKVPMRKLTAEDLSKDDVINNLLELQQTNIEVLDYLKDVLMSELPESQKVTETSRIIANSIEINKALYNIKFADEDEVKKDAKKQLSSGFIKDILDIVKQERKN